MRGGKRSRLFTDRFQYLPTKQGGLGLHNVDDIVKARQANRWTSLYTDRTFARGIHLGSIQQLLYHMIGLAELCGYTGRKEAVLPRSHYMHAEATLCPPWFGSAIMKPTKLRAEVRETIATMGSFLKPALPADEMREALRTTIDMVDSFHPLAPVRCEALYESVRPDCPFPNSTPFQQAHYTLQQPSFTWARHRERYKLSTTNIEIPPGADSLPASASEGLRTQRESEIKLFWESLAKILFTDQAAGESWRFLMKAIWRLPVETFGSDWLARSKFATNRDPACALCRGPTETHFHLHYQCPFVRDLWSRTMKAPFNSSPEALFKAFTDCSNATERSEWHRQQARFFHSVRRIVVYYRYHCATPPESLESPTEYTETWLKGFRPPHFKGTRRDPSLPHS